MNDALEVRPLAAVRIALGCVMLANLASRSAGFHETMAALGSMRGGAFWFGESLLADGAFLGASALVHVAWILGLRPLATGVLVALTWLVQIVAHPPMFTFAEHLQLYLSVIIAMSGSASGVLTRNAQGHWRLAYGDGAKWFHVAIQLQLALLYAGTGWAKTATSWFDGNALVFVYSNPWFSRTPDLGELFATMPGISALAGITVVMWERTFPLVMLAEWTGVLASSRTGLTFRRIFLSFGVVFHCAILLTMTVGFFSLVTLCCYLSFLGTRRLEISALRPPSLRLVDPSPTPS